VAGKLYIVATPIGNLKDITLRALDTLKDVDYIAAEDTRNTIKLLNYFEIKGKLISYHEHNKKSKGDEIISKLIEDSNIALVSDAGTPAISDPGEDLVKLAIENDIDIIPIPGAVAGISGLIVSGMDTRRFVFEGFLPHKKRDREERFAELKKERRTVILYEAPHKIKKTLDDILKYLGDRNISLAREITKKFEEKLRGSVSDMINIYKDKTPKGEYVITLQGNDGEIDNQLDENQEEQITVEEEILGLIEKGVNKKEAIKKVAQTRSLSKRQVYNDFEKFIKNT
jgi:16S rRNA (cytidine1402-2'-O)-methyltransferase